MSDEDARGRLPDDSDIEVDDRPGGRSVHLRASFLALVFAGGVLGTAAREALSLAFPTGDGIPYAIFGINVLGAFLLGLLLEALVRRGTDHGGRRAVRLFFGTGVLGGFTTYSALATDAAALIGRGEVLSGVGYGLMTVLIGAAATFAGIVVGAATHRSEAR
ncbi:MAG: CrcB family protein [Actinobacteria bacterium]|nr:CrcB family protein [Actinomycetota bacterium]